MKPLQLKLALHLKLGKIGISYQLTHYPEKWRNKMSHHNRITIEAGKRGGKPCIRKMRITVYDVLNMLARGMSNEEIIHDFPELELEDIKACLSFAADREHRVSGLRVA